MIRYYLIITLITIQDHMFREVIKFMKHDKLIAEDEMPTPENVENEEMEVNEVISAQCGNFIIFLSLKS